MFLQESFKIAKLNDKDLNADYIEIYMDGKLYLCNSKLHQYGGDYQENIKLLTIDEFNKQYNIKAYVVENTCTQMIKCLLISKN